MNRNNKQVAPAVSQKDFNDSFRPRQISDWHSELYSLTGALRDTIEDAFEEGDTVIEDIQAALNGNDDSPGFIARLLQWVQEGIDLDYSNYMAEQADANSNNTYWMNNSDTPEAKAGRSLSAANHAILKKATDGITGHVKDIKSIMTSAMQQGYPRTMSASQTPQTKEDDADVSTHLNELVASIEIQSAFRK